MPWSNWNGLHAPVVLLRTMGAWKICLCKFQTQLFFSGPFGKMLHLIHLCFILYVITLTKLVCKMLNYLYKTSISFNNVIVPQQQILKEHWKTLKSCNLIASSVNNSKDVSGISSSRPLTQSTQPVVISPHFLSKQHVMSWLLFMSHFEAFLASPLMFLVDPLCSHPWCQEACKPFIQITLKQESATKRAIWACSLLIKIYSKPQSPILTCRKIW